LWGRKKGGNYELTTRGKSAFISLLSFGLGKSLERGKPKPEKGGEFIPMAKKEAYLS